MSLLHKRRVLKAALVVACGAAAMVGPLASSASAATFFRTVDNQRAGLQLSITSNQNNSPLVFIPRFEGRSICSSCGVPETPAKQTWEQRRLVLGSTAILLVNKATGKCADIEVNAQRPGANAVGARVVLASCDGTPSQQWRNLDASASNQSIFRNQLTQLLLTSNGRSDVRLEPFPGRLAPQDEAKHVQTFGSTLVNVQ